MSGEETHPSVEGGEYLTVPELAKIVKRSRKTVYGWIVSDEIGEADGLFVVHGRYLIHWPTFRANQFKPRARLRGQLPSETEAEENGVAGDGQTRSPENRF